MAFERNLSTRGRIVRRLSLPGDQSTNDKGHTRAILIEATPEEIWPWIVELGQDRGAMCGNCWLENIIQADIHNIYEIKDELQVTRLGRYDLTGESGKLQREVSRYWRWLSQKRLL